MSAAQGRKTSGHWEHFSHAADIGVRGFGPTLELAFAQAALALTAIVCDPAVVRPEQAVSIHCEAPDRELLLVDWLNAIIYEMATRRMLFAEFQLSIHGEELHGLATGEAVDRQRHRPAVEPKGATLTELRVTRSSDGGWLAQCVVDV